MDGISSYNSFVALHKPQLVLSGVPEHFWPTLSKKIKDQIFDSGLTFQLVQIDYEEEEKMPYDPIWTVITICDIDRLDSSHIYLIDHAWTFKANSVKNSLRNVPGLLDRMCNLMQITDGSDHDKIEKVASAVWKYAHTYAVNRSDFTVEEQVPVWYVLDELGSGIIHSDNPNFRAVPFLHVADQMTYSILFPIENVEEGETVTRNYLEGEYSDSLQREAMLIPWKEYNHLQEDFIQIEPNVSYILDGHVVETLPNLDALQQFQKPNRFKVFSEYEYINQYLTAPEFEIVDSEEAADILWLITHFKNFQEFSENSPNKFINQFPFEYIVTVKDLLAIVSRRSAEQYYNKLSDNLQTYPVWLPTTFNMKTELPKLVSYYMQRQSNGLDNHWICKPYNLARGLDTYISDNLDFLCRLPSSGPKVAQKYIENPVLFERPDIGNVKFDIRYVVLLKSVNPTEVYIYNNFFLRFANKQFALNNFDDYEQHFTVMNYTEGAPLYRMLCADFKNSWMLQYPQHNWDVIEKSIINMFAELFISATSKNPPCGIAKSPQSRALYAADIMLSWEKNDSEMVMQPKLLEINWMPDCQRACEYYPEFYNDIFKLLFLGVNADSCTKVC